MGPTRADDKLAQQKGERGQPARGDYRPHRGPSLEGEGPSRVEECRGECDLKRRRIAGNIEAR
eukprot:3662268-Pyramimonas_sp.AAC.1